LVLDALGPLRYHRVRNQDGDGDGADGNDIELEQCGNFGAADCGGGGLQSGFSNRGDGGEGGWDGVGVEVQCLCDGKSGLAYLEIRREMKVGC